MKLEINKYYLLKNKWVVGPLVKDVHNWFMCPATKIRFTDYGMHSIFNGYNYSYSEQLVNTYDIEKEVGGLGEI